MTRENISKDKDERIDKALRRKVKGCKREQ